MKDSKLDIRYKDGVMQELRRLKAETGVPMRRLRGIAIEKLTEDEDSVAFVQERE